jgi:glycosyltransferase involved in cell wall biosynthesis
MIGSGRPGRDVSARDFHAARSQGRRSRRMAGLPSTKLSILFTHFGAPWIRGSEQVLIDLVTQLDPARFRPLVWCNAPPLENALRAAGIGVHRSDFTSFFHYDSPPFRPGRYFGFVGEGLRLARQHGVGLLHCNGAAPHQWMLPVARMAGLPVVAHLHANYLRRERFATLLHQASVLVGVSQSVVDDFLEDGFPPDRVRVIPNGINFSQFNLAAGRNLRAELKLPENAILIAAAGSLIRRKGFDLLIEALARLPDQPLHLAIAGDGPEKAPLAALAEACGVGARVHFLGYRCDISPLYAAGDIAALPSRSEAFGLALAEAGLFGLPVLASRVGGVATVVEDGVTGLLVPPENCAALTQALRRLAADADLRARLGAQGAARVRARFGIDRMVGEFERLYESLAAMPVSARRRWDTTPYLRLFRPPARPTAPP